MSNSSSNSLPIILGVVFAVLAIIGIAIVLFIIYKKKRNEETSASLDSVESDHMSTYIDPEKASEYDNIQTVGLFTTEIQSDPFDVNYEESFYLDQLF